MYLAQISFTVENETLTDDTVSDAPDILLGAMRMNGQICGRESPLISISAGYLASVLIPEQDSLDDGHNNSYVRKALEKLKSVGISQPHVMIFGDDTESDGVCSCTSLDTYILFTNYLSLESPLRCGNCFLPIPLYKIPPTYQDEYYDIIGWQSDYQSCDSLQMNSSILEKAATREISRVDSNLSVRGREICHSIAELTHRPTYYYLYRYGGRSRKQELKRLCPSCNGQWVVNPRWHLFDFRCDNCHLVSNIAWNVR